MEQKQLEQNSESKKCSNLHNTTKVYNEYPSKNNLFVITFVTKFYQNSKQEQEPIIKLSAAYTG